jgi:arabinosyltransferase C
VALGARVLPTYLKNEIDRDAGTLYAMVPDAPNALPASAAIQQTRGTHWGWYSPGPNSQPITGVAQPPSDPGPAP